MAVVAGVDVGNATTEVAFLDGDRLLGADRVPTRGRKGSADSLRGAAALVRRLERRLGCRVSEARVAPLRAVDTTTLTIPAAPPATGRLRLMAAGVATPGGAGAWAGVPLWLDRPLPPAWAGSAPPAAARAARIPAAAGEAGHAGAAPGPGAERQAGPPMVAMVPADFGYARAAERLRALLSAGVPVGAVLVGGDEGVLIFNRLSAPMPVIDQVDLTAVAGCDLVAVEVCRPGDPLTLLADPVALAAVFSLPADEAGDAATLRRMTDGADHAAVLADLLGLPVRATLSEPAAARLGALTTPGARPDAVVVDLGAGTVDVIAPDGEVVAAGAGDLLTTAVAETLRIPRAAADWVKRGPCLRVDGGQRFEAEDGSRGFLDRPAPATAAGMLAAAGPAGLLPFDREHSPAEWRAIRLRLKEAVFTANLRRALRTLGGPLPQVLLVGGPAGDDELLGV